MENISEIHRTEPYVYSQMVAGADAVRHGEAKNSWLTGTAAWTFVNVSQYLLGIRPDYDGLRIDPCIPPSFESFTVRRTFRDTVYDIHIENPDHVEKGVVSMTVDGAAIKGCVIPVQEGKKHCCVSVVMGRCDKL